MMCIQCEQTIMSFNIGTEMVQYLTVLIPCSVFSVLVAELFTLTCIYLQIGMK